MSFHNANNALKYLEGKGMDTSMGRVILASDVEAAIQLAAGEQLDRAVVPRPKTMAQAKRLVRQDEELMASIGRDNPPDFGEAVPAGPDSSSRT